MNKIYSLVAVAAAAAAFSPSMASAQSQANANVQVSATVLQTISVSNVQDLAFGKVGQSTIKTVAPDDATSGRFNVKGQGNARFNLTLVLPSVLTSEDEDELQIDTYAALSVDGADAANGDSWTPASGVATEFTLPGDVDDADQLKSFRIGATVTPDANQAAGVYSGTINVSAIYLDI